MVPSSAQPRSVLAAGDAASVVPDAPTPTDTDHDGMPDDWETAHGLDPDDPADGSATSPTGYTWVEDYINSLILMP